MTQPEAPGSPRGVRIATRSSALAMAQARQVADALPAECELVGLSTRGDRTVGALTEIGGKGLFTEALESALRAGRAHLAVHSAKDLPAALAADMTIAAVPQRADARDAVVSDGGGGLTALPAGARVGTSSLRRGLQVRSARPDVQVLPIRGNVDTRLRKLRDGQFDAVVLAMAGLQRLGVLESISGDVHPLDVSESVPAAGQGALAVECLTLDAASIDLVSCVNHPDSAAALVAERAVVRALEADCRSAVGVHICRGQAGWQGWAMVADEAGPEMIRITAKAPSAAAVAGDLTDRLTEAGAMELLRPGS